MKLKFLLILGTALLSFNSLLADTDPASPNPLSDSSIRKNSASEWCLFFNTQDSNGFYWGGSSCYGKSQLKSSIKQIWVKEGWFFKGHYTYEVLAGHGNDTIGNVSNKDVQKKFNEWEQERLNTEAKRIADDKRAADQQAAAEAAEAEEKRELAKMPTRAELCKVLNDKLAALIDPSYSTKAEEIIQSYPDTAISHFMPADLLVDVKKRDNSIKRDFIGVGVKTSEEDADYISTSPSPVSSHGSHMEDHVNYYFNVYDERSVWKQVNDFITAYKGSEVEEPTLEKHKHGERDTVITHWSASNEDLNVFLAYWGLQLSEENDPSLCLPAGMPKHVELIDPSNGEERQKWVMLIPLPEGEKLPESHYVIPTSPHPETAKKKYKSLAEQ